MLNWRCFWRLSCIGIYIEQELSKSSIGMPTSPTRSAVASLFDCCPSLYVEFYNAEMFSFDLVIIQWKGCIDTDVKVVRKKKSPCSLWALLVFGIRIRGRIFDGHFMSKMKFWPNLIVKISFQLRVYFAS
jgi:hypothetical protein